MFFALANFIIEEDASGTLFIATSAGAGLLSNVTEVPLGYPIGSVADSFPEDLTGAISATNKAVFVFSQLAGAGTVNLTEQLDLDALNTTALSSGFPNSLNSDVCSFAIDILSVLYDSHDTLYIGLVCVSTNLSNPVAVVVTSWPLGKPFSEATSDIVGLITPHSAPLLLLLHNDQPRLLWSQTQLDGTVSFLLTDTEGVNIPLNNNKGIPPSFALETALREHSSRNLMLAFSDPKVNKQVDVAAITLTSGDVVVGSLAPTSDTDFTPVAVSSNPQGSVVLAVHTDSGYSLYYTAASSDATSVSAFRSAVLVWLVSIIISSTL